MDNPCTHLFSERDIFLRRQWQQGLVAVTRPVLRWLRLFRPATIDLVLTKMMRGNDPQDMADAEFLVRRDHISEAQILEALSQLQPIGLVELRETLAAATPIVLAMARRIPGGPQFLRPLRQASSWTTALKRLAGPCPPRRGGSRPSSRPAPRGRAGSPPANARAGRGLAAARQGPQWNRRGDNQASNQAVNPWIGSLHG
jgi:hypothetical protein